MPWRLEAAAGQRINISLIDFAARSAADRNRPASRDVGHGDVISSGSCQRQYGYVVEKWNKKNVSLCAEGGAELRQSAVYTSHTNSLDIVLVVAHSQQTDASNYNFLIRVRRWACFNEL